MGIDPADHFKVLISVILILTLLGLLLIICLLMLWRRFNTLQNRPTRSAAQPPQADLWREAGQRMAHPPREEDEEESDEDPRKEDGRE